MKERQLNHWRKQAWLKLKNDTEYLAYDVGFNHGVANYFTVPVFSDSGGTLRDLFYRAYWKGYKAGQRRFRLIKPDVVNYVTDPKERPLRLPADQP